MRFKSLFLFVGIILLCSYQDPREPQTIYEPIIVSRSVLESSVKLSSPREMNKPGKIYLKDNVIYIVEKYEGIHIIDNSDRRNPKKVGFIQISGCIDLAIKGNNIYADNAVDLITISIENKQALRVTSRIKDVFPEITPPDSDYIPYQYTNGQRPENTIIVAWKEAGR